MSKYQKGDILIRTDIPYKFIFYKIEKENKYQYQVRGINSTKKRFVYVSKWEDKLHFDSIKHLSLYKRNLKEIFNKL